MDLRISIKDENGTTFDEIEIYRDGSDSEAAEKIRAWLEKEMGAAETEEFRIIRCPNTECAHHEYCECMDIDTARHRSEIFKWVHSFGITIGTVCACEEFPDKLADRAVYECPECGELTMDSIEKGPVERDDN